MVRSYNRFPQIIATLDPRVDVAVRLGAQAVEADARSRVPVDSGSLRDAIHTEKGEGGHLVVAGDSNVFYGHLVELGTSRVPPRPFLIPALEARRDEIVGLVAAALRKL
jgi:HK97 gp10 family phage protein